MSKKFSLALMILGFQFSIAQVIIGTTSGTPTLSSTSSLLEFYQPASNLKAIIMYPVVNVTTSTSVAEGTVAFDGATGSFRYKDISGWSIPKITSTPITVPVVADGSGVIIGTPISGAVGALVLESTDKALILPKIEKGQLLIAKPIAGMIYYDTYSKKVIAYNGSNWTEF